MLAINAVFNSWNGNKAHRVSPHRTHHRPQGHRRQRAGDGLRQHGRRLGHRRRLHPRPEHRRERLLRRYLINAQGEDVVAGIRTPEPIAEAQRSRCRRSTSSSATSAQMLEKHYKDMQDIEFTVQDGTLYMLQTRTGKRTGTAAVRIAVEMVKEKLIDETTAVKRVTPDALNHLLLPQLDPKAKAQVGRAGHRRQSRGGVGQGRPVRRGRGRRTPRSSRTIRSCSSARKPAPKTSPACIWPRASSPHRRQGEPRGRRRPRLGQAVRRRLRGGQDRRGEAARSPSPAQTVKAGDFITIDGTTGDVMIGKVPTVAPTMTGDFATLMGWADKVAQAEDSHQRRHAGRRRQGAASSAPKASACAAPSTCSSATTASPPCAR